MAPAPAAASPVPSPAASPRLRIGWESLATAVVGVGMALAAMPALQVSNPPLITYSDVFLLLGLTMLLPRLVSGRVVASPWYLIGALMLLCIALISLMAIQGPGQLQGLLRISYAMVVLPFAFMLWRPSVARIAFLMSAYVVGTVVSVIDGIITGPGGDGRTMGLTPHPNALGHTALMSLALVPFLSAVHPATRWLVRLAAMACLYGIWLSGSRGSLIALVLVALVYILIERSATAALFAWGVGIVVILVVPRLANASGNNAIVRVLGGGTASDATGQRELALHEALDQINAHPLLGNGFGPIRAAQDAYLQVLAALGIFGLMAVVLILLSFALPVRTAAHPIRLLSYMAVAYALLAPFTDSLSDTLIWAPMALCILVAPAREYAGTADLTPDDQPRLDSTKARHGSTGARRSSS